MILPYTSHDNVTVIKLPATLNMANAEQSRQALNHIITETGHSALVMDMRAVDFVDSSGLSVLVSIYKTAAKRKGKVALFQPTRFVKALIELTRLHEILFIYEDLDNAISDLQQAAA